MAWTSKDGKMTTAILNTEHLLAMAHALDETRVFDIVTEYQDDSNQVIESIIAKTRKRKTVIFSALIGSSGDYLTRYRTELFTRIS
jgi:hypothetical protein